MRERIKDIIKRVFEISKVENDISQNNCNKWDSMNHLNLVLELESEFDISLEPEEIAEMKNLYDIEKFIKIRTLNSK
jgi:acyl carrier protein